MRIVNSKLQYYGTKLYLLISGVVLIFSMESCRVYEKPVSFNEVIQNEEFGVSRVSMKDGKVYLFESIILKNQEYYGVRKINGNVNEVHLKDEDIKSVQSRNNKSSGLFNLTGIGIVLGSIALGGLFFGWY